MARLWGVCVCVCHVRPFTGPKHGTFAWWIPLNRHSVSERRRDRGSTAAKTTTVSGHRAIQRGSIFPGNKKVKPCFVVLISNGQIDVMSRTTCVRSCGETAPTKLQLSCLALEIPNECVLYQQMVKPHWTTSPEKNVWNVHLVSKKCTNQTSNGTTTYIRHYHLSS